MADMNTGTPFTFKTVVRYWQPRLWAGPWFLNRSGIGNPIWCRRFYIPAEGRTMKVQCLVGPAVKA